MTSTAQHTSALDLALSYSSNKLPGDECELVGQPQLVRCSKSANDIAAVAELYWIPAASWPAAPDKHKTVPGASRLNITGNKLDPSAGGPTPNLLSCKLKLNAPDIIAAAANEAEQVDCTLALGRGRQCAQINDYYAARQYCTGRSDDNKRPAPLAANDCKRLQSPALRHSIANDSHELLPYIFRDKLSRRQIIRRQCTRVQNARINGANAPREYDCQYCYVDLGHSTRSGMPPPGRSRRYRHITSADQDKEYCARAGSSCLEDVEDNDQDQLHLHKKTHMTSVVDAGRAAATSARICAHCNTTKTPLWRNGPKGPKSLCNACGIRYKKEERRQCNLLSTNYGGPRARIYYGHFHAHLHNVNVTLTAPAASRRCSCCCMFSA